MKPEVGKTYKCEIKGHKRTVKIIACDGQKDSYPYIGVVTTPGVLSKDFYQFDEHGRIGWWHDNCGWLEEIIEKPAIDWSKIPPWFNWFAADECGQQYFYSVKPSRGDETWQRVMVSTSAEADTILWVPPPHHYTTNIPWHESLTQRPT